jgi:hypothetical protein
MLGGPSIPQTQLEPADKQNYTCDQIEQHSRDTNSNLATFSYGKLYSSDVHYL